MAIESNLATKKCIVGALFICILFGILLSLMFLATADLTSMINI